MFNLNLTTTRRPEPRRPEPRRPEPRRPEPRKPEPRRPKPRRPEPRSFLSLLKMLCLYTAGRQVMYLA